MGSAAWATPGRAAGAEFPHSAAGGAPDALGVLRRQAVAFKLHAFLFESRNAFGDIRNFPAENSERLRLEAGGNDGDAEHDAVSVECNGETVLAEDAEAEHPFIKLAGSA